MSGPRTTTAPARTWPSARASPSRMISIRRQGSNTDTAYLITRAWSAPRFLAACTTSTASNSSQLKGDPCLDLSARIPAAGEALRSSLDSRLRLRRAAQVRRSREPRPARASSLPAGFSSISRRVTARTEFLTTTHLRRVVCEWAAHYNRARPHMALGSGVPEPNELYPAPRLEHRHRLPDGARVVSTPVLGGLHHEYRFEQRAA